MSFFSKLFTRRPDPIPPIVEYPDGDGLLQSAGEALEQGLRVYRKTGGGRPAVISWQGQGGRIDSYHVADLGLVGDVVSFRDLTVDVEHACVTEGFPFDSLRMPEPSELNIGSLSEPEAARLIEALLVKHGGMNPFEDSRDFCVAIEYEEADGTAR